MHHTPGRHPHVEDTGPGATEPGDLAQPQLSVVAIFVTAARAVGRTRAGDADPPDRSDQPPPGDVATLQVLW